MRSKTNRAGRETEPSRQDVLAYNAGDELHVECGKREMSRAEEPRTVRAGVSHKFK